MPTDPGPGPADVPPEGEPPLTSDSGQLSDRNITPVHRRDADTSAPAESGTGQRVSDTALNRVVREMALDALAHPDLDRAPESIGPWRILRPLGEGGFGIVYHAERASPAQQAAIKLIKPGMDSRAVLARFDAERQALALLTHPNIARLYDAGVFDGVGGGRPYFAMEYVPGLPITDFCERKKLDLTARLKLFQQVCQAVQHAHLKAIIHRDISARNVLVTEIDGAPTAKVIDFGIAKAMGQELTEKTIDTGVGNIIGNYAYMSPEQAAGDPDIDARTDVYSLGVLLYELLTGERPFDNATIQKAGDFGIRKLIVETDPPRPSDRTTTLEMTAILRRELEWIPLKALRKDRTRRYQTPSDFADDIQNYLDNKPLSAGPESRVYQLRKFSSRNRAALMATAAGLLVTIAGTALYIHQIRAEQARTLAALNRADAESAEKEKQRARAQAQATTTSAIATFLAEMLTRADPNQTMGDAVTVVQAIAAGTKELDDGKLASEQEAEASVRLSIAATLLGLGRLEEAERNVRIGLALRRSALGPTSLDVANDLSTLGAILNGQGRNEEAVVVLREALAIIRAAPPEPTDTLPSTLSNLALTLTALGDAVSAEPLMRESIALRSANQSEQSSIYARSLSNLAVILEAQNKVAEAEPLYVRALDVARKTLPPNHPFFANLVNNTSVNLIKQGKFAEAEPLMREAVSLARASLPAGHPNISNALSNLGRVLRSQGKFAEAEPICREALEIGRAVFPKSHPNLGQAANNLALVLFSQSHYEEALPLFQESLSIRVQTLGPEHEVTYRTAFFVAQTLDALNRPEEAAALRTKYRLGDPATRPSATPATRP